MKVPLSLDGIRVFWSRAGRRPLPCREYNAIADMLGLIKAAISKLVPGVAVFRGDSPVGIGQKIAITNKQAASAFPCEQLAHDSGWLPI